MLSKGCSCFTFGEAQSIVRVWCPKWGQCDKLHNMRLNMTFWGPAQLEKAQEQHSKWQGLGKTHPERRRLETDIEDECKSISWQARGLMHLLGLERWFPFLVLAVG